MWLNDIFSRSWGRKRSVLRVNSSRVSRKVQTNRATMAVIIPTAAFAACLIIWLFARIIGGALFYHNDRFKIVNLDIRTGGRMFTRELVKEYMGISEGANLFAIDISKTRESFLKRASSVKSIQILRILPDTLKVQIVERSAVARIDVGENLVVDADGCVFWQRTQQSEVPLMVGLAGEVIRPGSRLANHALAAIDVVEAARDPRYEISVSSVAVDRPEFVLLKVASPQGDKEVKLSWEGMDSHNPVSKRRLAEKLDMVSDALHSDEGKALKKFDATYEGGRIYGT